METININGKEYTKEEFTSMIKYWKVNRLFKNLLEIESQPPKLRRMSELPEFKRVNIKVDRFSAKNNSGSFWIIGSKRIDRAGNIVIESKFATFRFEAGIYLNNEHGAKLTGWLPLPNPNDIKL